MTVKTLRLTLLTCLLTTLFWSTKAQFSNIAVTDSMKAKLARTHSIPEKVSLLDELSRTMMNLNPKEGDSLGSRLIAIAEESRDRSLMVKAYRSNGMRCSYLANQKEYAEKGMNFLMKALELAKQNNLEAEIAGTQLEMAYLHLMNRDAEKALNSTTQAFSVISAVSNDSLKAEAHNMFGQVYKMKNEKILALRNFLTALRIAEEKKEDAVIRNSYLHLSSFYSSIEDYDKAIDYYKKALEKLDQLDEKNAPYQRVIYINQIGSLFAAKKNYDIAISYFERSIAMADSLQFPTLKMPGYVSLLNQFLRSKEPGKALQYLNSEAGQKLKLYLTTFGMAPVIDQAYGVVYSELGRFDSARASFMRAQPFFENGLNETNKLNFYGQLADYYQKSGDNQKAISYFLQVKQMSEKMGLLENIQLASKHLDSLYKKTGNLNEALKYNSIYYQYKDSIEKLGREKEITQVAAEDEQQRVLRAEKEKEEAEKKRKSTQLMAIAIGIAMFFIALVMLGMFKVSKTTIRYLGFFAFIMLFEFIFLVFKKNIAGFTKGEPWKDLLFMIALAAVLVPLHHWLEHKVIHYLTSHNRLTASGRSLLARLKGKAASKPAEPDMKG